MDPEPIDPLPQMPLRPYQVDCINAVREGWKKHNRILIVIATGGGKTVVFSHIAEEEVRRGGKVLILAHTDELLDQAIDKLYKATGIIGEKEKADERASPYASVVVASIQSISRINRLTSFSDDHFDLVICDESHRVLAPSYLRVMSYFHFGAESLAENWVMPAHGIEYKHKARCLGVTATPDRGDKRSLGEFYQECVFEYGLLQACRDGYLVRPIVQSIPLEIDLRRRSKDEKIVKGGDYNAEFLAERIRPLLKTIAAAIFPRISTRKSVCFLPSVDTARILAEELALLGLNASFVSGACDNRNEKVAAFDAAPTGSAICCAILLTEGWDCPSVDCVVPLRLTKIRSLYVQCVGRAARTLPGVIDGLDTREERLQAIASSPKKNMLIIDVFWLTGNLDLVSPVYLVSDKPEVRERMEKMEGGDLIEREEKAQRDFLKSMEAAAKRAARRKAMVIDPLAWAVSLGDATLANYEPESSWDEEKPTPGQIDFIQKQGMKTDGIWCKGLASRVINKLVMRMKQRYATPKQLSLLHMMGLPDEEAALMTIEEASAAIDSIKSGKLRGASVAVSPAIP